MNNDKEVQIIFNKVINAGLYDPFTKFDECSKNYMCNSLKVAASRSVISFHDYTVAKNAIRQYLKSSLETMYTFLKNMVFLLLKKTVWPFIKIGLIVLNLRNNYEHV